MAEAAARVSATVDPPWSLEAWRAQARAALCAEVPPDAIDWDETGGSLLRAPPVAAAQSVHDAPAVPGAFLSLAQRVLTHDHPQRFALLYRLLWRLTHGEPTLLDHSLDADVHRAYELDKAVRRDHHKMKAFVRFREVPGEPDAFVAWFEPTFRIVDLVAPFFMRRFAGMRWAILTPYRSARWDGAELSFGEGATRADAPADDDGEDLWRAYYASIFNPARINPQVMRAEMPRKYWKNLPEAQLLPQLIREADVRVRGMVERAPEPPRKHIPAPVEVLAAPVDDLDSLRRATSACRRCPLWQPATQAVSGEGPSDARIVLVGEQPGDEEDISGRPFIGPAGRLLNRALAQLGVPRESLYLTNAVKHFKFQQRGKRRLHQRASPAEQRICGDWLHREIALLKPEKIVCLGATAAHALLGRDFALMRQRGQWFEGEGGMRLMATVHPAWILRQSDPSAQDAAYAGWLDDLRTVFEASPTPA